MTKPKTQDQPEESPAPEPEPEQPDYTDGTWYVPAGSASYVKRPEYTNQE
jgi:hypothetical protein